MWVDLLKKYVAHLDYDAEGPEDFAKYLTKVAAIACAALESRDRMGD